MGGTVWRARIVFRRRCGSVMRKDWRHRSLITLSAGHGARSSAGWCNRGPSLPWLEGAYLYADYCSGELWGLRYDGERVVEHALLNDSVRRVTAFGEDEEGDVYVVSFDGRIYRLAEKD